MIETMPRPRPLYLQHEKTRHGKYVWYFRRGDGPRIRMHGEYGSVEFSADYQAALNAEPVHAPAKKLVSKGTLAWLIANYRGSSAWAELSMATRRQRENIFKHVIASAGDKPIETVTRKSIVNGREGRKDTPAQANNFLKAMRGLFKWALDAEHVKADPTRDVNWLKVKTEGFHVWTEDEVARYEARWPVGTRERVAFDVLLYTGLRRGDAVTLGRQHVRNGVFKIRTEKTGADVEAPILPALAATLAAGPTGDLAFIVGERGQPMAKESFGTWFKIACKAAGVPGSAHGLRKAGATRAAGNGASTKQLEAIFGWEGGKMASHYTRSADRAKLARDAMPMLEREQPPNELSPHLNSGAGADGKSS